MKQLIDKIPVRKDILALGAIAGALLSVVALGKVAVDNWPLSAKSEVVVELHQTDKSLMEFDEDHDIELQIQRAKMEQNAQEAALKFQAMQREMDKNRHDDLQDYIDKNTMLLSQFEGRTNLNELERQIKTSWENDVREYLLELNELAAKRNR